MWKEELFRVQPGAKTWMLAFVLLEEAQNALCPYYFKLPNQGLAAMGINRRAKWRALRELEGMGLIRVEKTKRKSPRIRVKWLT